MGEEVGRGLLGGGRGLLTEEGGLMGEEVERERRGLLKEWGREERVTEGGGES